jgi:hypothetical protein
MLRRRPLVLGLSLTLLLLGLVPIMAQPAAAHGGCTLTAGRDLAFSGFMQTGRIRGWARVVCDENHKRVDAKVNLQMKWQGTWRTVATTGNNWGNCCDAKVWNAFTPWCDAFTYNDLQWRIYVDWFHVWNANNVIAHSWPSGVKWSGTIDVVEAC